jgi:hypothetical protein
MSGFVDPAARRSPFSRPLVTRFNDKCFFTPVTEIGAADSDSSTMRKRADP